MGQALDLRRLVDLLKSLFSVDDLRRWIHQSFGRAVADELPGSGTGLAQFASDVAMTLERHGLIGPRRAAVAAHAPDLAHALATGQTDP
jgi:hypothetical protein